MSRSHQIALLALLVLLGSAFGCTQDQSALEPAATTPIPGLGASLSPEQLGQLGAEIRKSPDRADEILTRHGLTRTSFDEAIRAVTEDAEASKRYATAYRRAAA